MGSAAGPAVNLGSLIVPDLAMMALPSLGRHNSPTLPLAGHPARFLAAPRRPAAQQPGAGRQHQRANGHGKHACIQLHTSCQDGASPFHRLRGLSLAESHAACPAQAGCGSGRRQACRGGAVARQRPSGGGLQPPRPTTIKQSRRVHACIVAKTHAAHHSAHCPALRRSSPRALLRLPLARRRGRAARARRRRGRWRCPRKKPGRRPKVKAVGGFSSSAFFCRAHFPLPVAHCPSLSLLSPQSLPRVRPAVRPTPRTPRRLPRPPPLGFPLGS